MTLVKGLVVAVFVVSLSACSDDKEAANTSAQGTDKLVLGNTEQLKEEVLSSVSDPEQAPLEKDIFGKVEALPTELHPHWLWVVDIAASSMPDGRSYLYDGDSGKVLGMLNHGYSFHALTIPRHYREIYGAETYYARHTRGKRTDVVSVYDPFKLLPVAEIEIPPKRASTLPRLSDAALTDNDRFMSVFNLTPASSLSIVDLQKREFVAEILIPGCTMTYAAGERRFFSLCSDGSLLLTQLAEEGNELSKTKSEPFFDVHKDPIIETGIRSGDIWYFASVLGKFYTVDIANEEVAFQESWPFLTAAEIKENWRIGGMVPFAIHHDRQHAYLIMHQGDFFSYEEPGPEIWVIDLAKQEKIATFKARQPVISIAVSQDDAPLLYGITEDLQTLDIYDAVTGEHLRSASELGVTPLVVQVPEVH